MSMTIQIKARYNYVWQKPVVKSEPIKEDFELVTIINPISFNEDKTVKEYTEIQKFNCRKTKWHDFIQSYDIGSPAEQVLNHLQKGTPLITAHTLPDGDYTKDSLLKGAELKRKLAAQGITLDMIADAVAQNLENKDVKVESKVDSQGDSSNGENK